MELFRILIVVVITRICASDRLHITKCARAHAHTQMSACERKFDTVDHI